MYNHEDLCTHLFFHLGNVQVQIRLHIMQDAAFIRLQGERASQVLLCFYDVELVSLGGGGEMERQTSLPVMGKKKSNF